MSRLVQLSTIRDRVITLCDLPAALDTTTSPTASQMLDLLQVSASMLSGMVREFPGASLHFAESSTLTTASGIASVSLPSSASDVLRVAWSRDATTEVLLQRATVEQMRPSPQGWDTAMVPTYRVVGNTLEFYPTPDGVYNISVYYSTGLYPSSTASYLWCMDGWDQWVAIHASTLVRARQQRACPELDMMLAQLGQGLRNQFKRDISPAQVRDVRCEPVGYEQLMDPRKW
jgi:hypothetical protein